MTHSTEFIILFMMNIFVVCIFLIVCLTNIFVGRSEHVKKCCFPNCWKVSSVVHVFKNVGERSIAKSYHPVGLVYVVSKVFEKLVNRIVDHLEKSGLFSDFQYGFRSSRSTADLLTVVSDRIARAFNKSEAG